MKQKRAGREGVADGVGTPQQKHRGLGWWLHLTLVLTLLVVPQWLGGPTEAAPVRITNGVQFTDIDGNVIHAHGGGMIREGEYYYWLGENRDGENLVSLYRSKDLYHWEFVAHLLSKSMGGELATANIERPKLLYNEATGLYVMWMHKENGRDYTEGRVAVATSPNIAGPYTYLGSWRPDGYDSRDMTVYNDNGTAYLFSATRVNADLNIFRLNAEFTDVEELVHTLWIDQYREAPAVFKRGSTYFMVTSGATGWNPNQAKYATASSIEGAWTQPQNFADSTTFGSQPTFVIPIEGSETTSYLYMGDRWAGAWGGPVNDSRYVWLPLTFPDETSLAMEWYPTIEVDTVTGHVQGLHIGGPFDPETVYQILSVNSQKALEAEAQAIGEGANVQQWGNWGGANQRWRIEGVGSYYKIVNLQTGYVLEVEGGSTANGGNVVLGEYTGADHQQWSIVYAGNDSYRIVNRKSGKSLDIEAQSTADGANAHQWDDWGGANQRWFIRPAL